MYDNLYYKGNLPLNFTPQIEGSLSVKERLYLPALYEPENIWITKGDLIVSGTKRTAGQTRIQMEEPVYHLNCQVGSVNGTTDTGIVTTYNKTDSLYRAGIMRNVGTNRYYLFRTKDYYISGSPTYLSGETLPAGEVGNLYSQGNYLTNTLSVASHVTTSNLKFGSVHTLSQSLDIPGAMTINNACQVKGYVTLSNAFKGNQLQISNNLSLGTDLDIDGTLQVGPTTLQSNSLVKSSAFMSNHLYISGNSTLSGNLLGESNSIWKIDGILSGSERGKMNTLSVAGNTILAGTLFSFQSITLSGDISIGGAATLSRNIIIRGNVTLSSTLHLASALGIDATFGTSGDIVVTSKLSTLQGVQIVSDTTQTSGSNYYLTTTDSQLFWNSESILTHGCISKYISGTASQVLGTFTPPETTTGLFKALIISQDSAYQSEMLLRNAAAGISMKQAWNHTLYNPSGHTFSVDNLSGNIRFHGAGHLPSGYLNWKVLYYYDQISNNPDGESIMVPVIDIPLQEDLEDDNGTTLSTIGSGMTYEGGGLKVTAVSVWSRYIRYA